MAIKKENISVQFIISRKLYTELLEEAEYQDRSISNLVARIVKHYLKNKKDISLE